MHWALVEQGPVWGNLGIGWQSLCCCFLISFPQVEYSFTWSAWVSVLGLFGFGFWVLQCKFFFLFCFLWRGGTLILWLTVVWMCSCFKQVDVKCSFVLTDPVSFRSKNFAFLNYWEIFLLEFETWNNDSKVLFNTMFVGNNFSEKRHRICVWKQSNKVNMVCYIWLMALSRYSKVQIGKTNILQIIASQGTDGSIRIKRLFRK